LVSADNQPTDNRPVPYRCISTSHGIISCSGLKNFVYVNRIFTKLCHRKAAVSLIINQHLHRWITTQTSKLHKHKYRNELPLSKLLATVNKTVEQTKHFCKRMICHHLVLTLVNQQSALETYQPRSRWWV